MLHSRQPQRLGLLGLLLGLSLMHMSPPAQAGETRSETAVRGVEQAVQGTLGITPLSLAVVLALSPVEPPTVEPPSVPKPSPPAAEAQNNHEDDDGDDDDGDDGDDGDGDDDGDDGPPQAPPPPPPPLPPPVPPSGPDAGTAPLGLSNPQPFGCEFAGDEIACEETGATLPFIRFDVDIPENAGFLQFDYTFTGADRAVSGTEGVDTARRSDGEDRRRASVGDLGAVFIVNVPIAALPASGVLQEGVFQSSGQSRLPRSRRGTMFIANFPSGLAGSVFRVRNLRVDRCTQKCFRKRATLCGTDGPDKLTGTRGRDVIAGRRGNDTIKGLGGDDLICGGEGKDRLSGGPGRDRLDGGLDRDTCDGGTSTDGARRCDRKRAIP